MNLTCNGFKVGANTAPSFTNSEEKLHDRDRQQAHRAQLSEVEKHRIHLKDAARKASSRQSMTAEQKAAAREQNRERHRSARQEETEEEYRERLAAGAAQRESARWKTYIRPGEVPVAADHLSTAPSHEQCDAVIAEARALLSAKEPVCAVCDAYRPMSKMMAPITLKRLLPDKKFSSVPHVSTCPSRVSAKLAACYDVSPCLQELN